jgi:two-component system sensor histidine kinase KdpD
MLLRPVIGSRFMGFVYLLGVDIAALFVGRGATLFAAAMSGLFWDFCFLEPIGKLLINNVEDVFMFGTFMVVALVVGQVTTGIRAREKRERLRGMRFAALYQLTGKLVEATDVDEMLQNAVQQTEASFAAHIALLLVNSAGELSHHAHYASTYDITGPEQPVADWVFENGQAAGQFTGKFAQVDTLFVPLRVSGRTLGVMGLNFREPSPPSREHRRLLEEFGEHIARVLARYRSGTESQERPHCWLNPRGAVRTCST